MIDIDNQIRLHQAALNNALAEADEAKRVYAGALENGGDRLAAQVAAFREVGLTRRRANTLGRRLQSLQIVASFLKEQARQTSDAAYAASQSSDAGDEVKNWCEAEQAVIAAAGET